MTDFDQELTTRRAVVAQANTTSTLTTCPRCGQLYYQGATHMCPDFDEPMEFVESRRLRELEAMERELAALHGFVPHCGHCGQTMQACACGTRPAKPETPVLSGEQAKPTEAPTMPAPDANIASEPPPSGWRDRPGLL